MLLVFGVYILFIVLNRANALSIENLFYMVSTTGLLMMFIVWAVWFGVAYLCLAI